MILPSPKISFLDRLNDYLPETVNQSRRPWYMCSRYEIKSEQKQRIFCLSHFFINVILSPMQSGGLILLNTYRIGKETASLMLTSIALPFKLVSKPAAAFNDEPFFVIRTAMRIADLVVAISMAPFSPMITCGHFFIGVIKPNFYFKSHPLLLNDRLFKIACNDDLQFSVSSKSNTKVQANQSIISALMNYSFRWGLISTSPISFCTIMGNRSCGVLRTKRTVNRQINDKVMEKYRLLQAFGDLKKTPEKFESDKKIRDFIHFNFRTPKQRAVLKMFLKKGARTILNFSECPSQLTKKQNKEIKKNLIVTLSKLKGRHYSPWGYYFYPRKGLGDLSP